MSYRLWLHFLVWFILFSIISTLIDGFSLILKLKHGLAIVDVWWGLWKATGQTSLLTLRSLNFILFHLLHPWRLLRFFALICYLFSKLSKTCTRERIIVFLFICCVFQEVFELDVKIIVFVNDWVLVWRSMINSISAKLIVENIEIIKVVLLLTILVGVLLNRVIIHHLLNVSLYSFTLFLNLPFSTCTSILVFGFDVFLLSHEFRKL